VGDPLTFKAQSGKQLAFLSTRADIAIYGGARGGGKSFALLLEALRHTKNPEFNAIIFRRTYKQIEQPQGLWETSNKIYPYTGATGTFGNLIWKWNNGSYVRFMHMEDEANRLDWLGAGIPLICFDELVTFTESQFFFMFGSNRSTCGVRPYIRATTNPDARSWVARFIEWWIDQETGYPIEDRCGVIRYFVRDKEAVVWADTEAELQEQFPEMWAEVAKVEGAASPAKSCTFIPANVFDNKILLEKDPTYLASLYALSTIDRERYLRGNWKISELGGKMFKREWFDILPEAPAGLNKFVRYWDLAATEPKKKNMEPDWTCGVLMSLRDGIWYICDVQRFRGTPQVVEKRVLQCAQMDPYGAKIRMEQEPGASGITAIDHYARFILVGYSFKGIPSLKNKVLRAGPFSSAAEAHNVKLIKGPWNNTYLDEVEQFKGQEEKNDQVDATSGAMQELRGAGGDWKFARAVSTSPGYQPLISAAPIGKWTPIGG
jgi:predicted phage terminase large subunit-like protein